jgi:hypothetical protein
VRDSYNIVELTFVNEKVRKVTAGYLQHTHLNNFSKSFYLRRCHGGSDENRENG